jgi:hypothetical protein
MSLSSELEATAGGVWTKSHVFTGLRLNNPRKAYAFSDFDYPESLKSFQWPETFVMGDKTEIPKSV